MILSILSEINILIICFFIYELALEDYLGLIKIKLIFLLNINFYRNCRLRLI